MAIYPKIVKRRFCKNVSLYYGMRALSANKTSIDYVTSHLHDVRNAVKSSVLTVVVSWIYFLVTVHKHYL